MAAVDRRQMVMDAAAKSFSLFGYKATTMDQVAKIANVGKGTIYTFFTTKEELFDEILKAVIQDMKRVVELNIREDVSFFDNLYRGLDALLEFRGEHELLVKLSQEVREFGTPQAQEAMQRIENVVLDYVEKQIVRAEEQGEIVDIDPKIVSFVLLKLYIALSLEWNKQHEALSKEEIKKYVGIFMAEGLAKKR
ncbi:TetR family transcriptional regulator [Paenibacillus sp. CAA11]|uniref:TetR/AcrR family transcriptional regulator n=1 Tax=Paenibacillus sp. CAA11 TaxID=1532905 RepID=UPI000D3822D3|nr:TetR/AcrR family transcriptional regulator [Paenibacillus sp. CAA11]AWB43612.1 TetR family transcriptional regulator [Paenibacillus sp. CAA11]